MTINTTKDGEKLTMAVEGNLGTATAGDLDAEVKKNIDGIKELVFDFEKLAYMASAGLRVLMSTGKMKIINCPPQLMDVFAITGVKDVLDITPA